jgi:hypothetical protein
MDDTNLRGASDEGQLDLVAALEPVCEALNALAAESREPPTYLPRGIERWVGAILPRLSELEEAGVLSPKAARLLLAFVGERVPHPLRTDRARSLGGVSLEQDALDAAVWLALRDVAEAEGEHAVEGWEDAACGEPGWIEHMSTTRIARVLADTREVLADTLANKKPVDTHSIADLADLADDSQPSTHAKVDIFRRALRTRANEHAANSVAPGPPIREDEQPPTPTAADHGALAAWTERDPLGDGTLADALVLLDQLCNSEQADLLAVMRQVGPNRSAAGRRLGWGKDRLRRVYGEIKAKAAQL